MPNRNGTITREFMVTANEIAGDSENREMWLEGYAVRFDSPTVLFEWDGVEYKEQIASGSLNECRMDDVIFNYNHSGKVMARTRNKTLQLEVRNEGLFIRARVDGTEEGRKIYEEVKGGYIDRMSFAFRIREESYDKKDHLWTVKRISRLYDVSAVSMPAYEDTIIEARKNFVLEADAQDKREREAAADLLKRKLSLKLRLSQRGE